MQTYRPAHDRYRCWSAVAVATLAALVTACDRQETAGPPRKQTATIVTTVGMVTDIVRTVAGERAEVAGLIGSGVDPHLYNPTRNDVIRLMEADIVFYCGLMLEGKMASTLAQLAKSGKPIHAVTEEIDPRYLLAPEGGKGHHDPHVWMDVSAWSKCVDAVADALAKHDLPHADEYRSRAAAYRERLTELDAYVRRVIQSIPEEQRVLVTAHDAFNYFGRAYGLEVLGIQGISTESEAGLDDINRLVDTIVARNVPAVFVETSVADKNVRALLEGAASRGHEIRIGGTLFSDAMGPADTYEGTYIGMLDHNATTIARALGGAAPQRGLHDQLSLGE